MGLARSHGPFLSCDCGVFSMWLPEVTSGSALRQQGKGEGDMEKPKCGGFNESDLVFIGGHSNPPPCPVA